MSIPTVIGVGLGLISVPMFQKAVEPLGIFSLKRSGLFKYSREESVVPDRKSTDPVPDPVPYPEALHCLRNG